MSETRAEYLTNGETALDPDAPYVPENLQGQHLTQLYGEDLIRVEARIRGAWVNLLNCRQALKEAQAEYRAAQEQKRVLTEDRNRALAAIDGGGD